MALSEHPLEPSSDEFNLQSTSRVVVGDTVITVQQLQQIYAELTGKPESLTSYYDDPIRLSFDDIEQLYFQLTQTLEQYNVLSQSCSVTVYYLRKTKDVFNSFDRARLQMESGADPIESILLKFGFLLMLPSLSTPQNYSVSVRVVSRLAVERRMREGTSPFSIPRFIRTMAHYTGSAEITYVDYAVARSFRTAVDEWFKTIPRSNENKFMKWLQKYTHWFPRISRFTTAIVMAAVLLDLFPHFVKGTDLIEFGRFLLCGSLGTYAAYMIAGWLAIFAENEVDNWTSLSYIKINRGDTVEIDKSINENRNFLIKGAAGLSGVIIVDIVAKLIAEMVVKLL